MTPDCQKTTDGCSLFFVEPAAPCEKKAIKCDCGTDPFFGGIAQGGLEGDRLEPEGQRRSGQCGVGGPIAAGDDADDGADRAEVAYGNPEYSEHKTSREKRHQSMNRITQIYG